MPDRVDRFERFERSEHPEPGLDYIFKFGYFLLAWLLFVLLLAKEEAFIN